MKVLIIIPAFNEQDSIHRVVSWVQKYNFDILVVNDCSTDNTDKIISDMNVNHISLPINLGIGGAMQTGYKYAEINNYDVAIQIDGDGQHSPDFIESLLAYIENYNMVIGSRFLEKKGFQSTILRRIGIHFFKWLNRTLIGIKITDNTSGFRAVDKKLISFFANDYPSDFPEPESIITISKLGYKIKEVPVKMNERIGGVSSIIGLKSGFYMVKVFLSIIITYIRGGK